MVEYKIIREIQENPFHTQRSLAHKLNISLGKAHYLLTGLAEKGLIRARKLKNHPEKIRWQYVLTPVGLKEKLRLTRDYLSRREREFSELQKEIAELRKEIGEAGEPGRVGET